MKWPTKLVMKWPKTWPGAVAAIAAAVATVAAIFFLLPVIALGAGLWVGAHTRRQSPPAPLPPPPPPHAASSSAELVRIRPLTMPLAETCTDIPFINSPPKAAQHEAKN